MDKMDYEIELLTMLIIKAFWERRGFSNSGDLDETSFEE